MRKVTFLSGAILVLFLTGTTHAQPVLDVKTELRQLELQGTQPTATSSPTNTARTQPPTASQNQTTQYQSIDQLKNLLDSLQNKITALEDQSKKIGGDPKVNNWLGGWWQIGFWVGVLWLFPWVFVGWQWTKFKFWNFGWPWPWWFWIPLIWFIPWLWIGWQWWLIWWVWWIWIWWLFPWVFWVFWWIIIFKEASLWHWHRRRLSNKETG